MGSALNSLIFFTKRKDRHEKTVEKVFSTRGKFKMTFGDLLKIARAKKRLTQKATSTYVGCPLNTYQKWEYDKQKPSGIYTLKLIKLLDLDPEKIQNILENE